jgi:thiol-disulfide isomerase/thioredoxin
MSSILYYSKYCEVCKKYLQTLSKTQSQKDIHFICIDKRIKDELNNKWYIILENEQKIILPNNVTKVPALLLLNQGYQVLYGDQILQHLKPQEHQEIKKATKNNMEPMAFSFGGSGGFGDIVSDQYSFLDLNEEDLKATGNGGMRQMHNYVDLNTAFNCNLSEINQIEKENNTTIRGAQKMGEDSSNQIMEDRIRKMKEDRDADIRSITGNKPPISY